MRFKLLIKANDNTDILQSFKIAKDRAFTAKRLEPTTDPAFFIFSIDWIKNADIPAMLNSVNTSISMFSKATFEIVAFKKEDGLRWEPWYAPDFGQWAAPSTDDFFESNPGHNQHFMPYIHPVPFSLALFEESEKPSSYNTKSSSVEFFSYPYKPLHDQVLDYVEQVLTPFLKESTKQEGRSTFPTYSFISIIFINAFLPNWRGHLTIEDGDSFSLSDTDKKDINNAIFALWKIIHDPFLEKDRVVILRAISKRIITFFDTFEAPQRIVLKMSPIEYIYIYTNFRIATHKSMGSWTISFKIAHGQALLKTDINGKGWRLTDISPEELALEVASDMVSDQPGASVLDGIEAVLKIWPTSPIFYTLKAKISQQSLSKEPELPAEWKKSISEITNKHPELYNAFTKSLDENKLEQALRRLATGKDKLHFQNIVTIAETLLKHNPTLNLNAASVDGKTAAHYAVISGNKLLVDFLKAHGAAASLIERASGIENIKLDDSPSPRK